MFPSPAASAAAAAVAASTPGGIGSVASSYNNAMSHESGAGGVGGVAPGSAHAGGLMTAAETLFVPNRNSSAMLAHYSVPASAASPISTSSTPPASAASNHTVSQYLQKRVHFFAKSNS